MWLPTRLYEALPALYVSTGLSIMVCAAYIGVGSGLMLGYLASGSGCVMGGIYVRWMRDSARSERTESHA